MKFDEQVNFIGILKEKFDVFLFKVEYFRLSLVSNFKRKFLTILGHERTFSQKWVFTGFGFYVFSRLFLIRNERRVFFMRVDSSGETSFSVLRSAQGPWPRLLSTVKNAFPRSSTPGFNYGFHDVNGVRDHLFSPLGFLSGFGKGKSAFLQVFRA